MGCAVAPGAAAAVAPGWAPWAAPFSDPVVLCEGREGGRVVAAAGEQQ